YFFLPNKVLPFARQGFPLAELAVNLRKTTRAASAAPFLMHRGSVYRLSQGRHNAIHDAAASKGADQAMPISHSVWTVSQTPEAVPQGVLPSEQMLEQMIIAESRILSAEWMLIGRQVDTGFGGRIDLLAIAP